MLTTEQFEELYPRARDEVKRAFIKTAGPLAKQYGLSATRTRTEYFLAQIGHESGGLTITEENLNYSAKRLMQVWPSRFPTLAAAQPYANNPQKLANKVYASRMGNGPPESGDGYRYRGRGFIQITGRDGYRRVGGIADIDLESAPEKANGSDALLVACAFWKWKGINVACDAGDFTRATKLINGGTTGLQDRLAWLDKVRRVLAARIIPSQQPDSATVRAVQLALRARGYTAIGAADGLLGPRTAAAILAFRTAQGMGDGGIDDTLLTVLDIE